MLGIRDAGMGAAPESGRRAQSNIDETQGAIGAAIVELHFRLPVFRTKGAAHLQHSDRNINTDLLAWCMVP